MNLAIAPLQTKRSEVALSVSVLFFAFFIFLVTRDLFYDASWPQGWDFRQEYQYWTELYSLVIVVLFGIPTLIWHGCEYLSDREAVRWSGRLISSYPVFLGILVMGLVGNAIIESGVTEWLSCYDAYLENNDGDNFFFTCSPTPNAFFEVLVLPFLLALLFIAFARVGRLIVRKRA